MNPIEIAPALVHALAHWVASIRRRIALRLYLRAVREAVDAISRARVLGIRLGMRGECARECQALAEMWERTARWEEGGCK